MRLMEIFGKRLRIKISGKSEVRMYTALLSTNTIPSELPFRITWFTKEMNPMGHVDMTRRDANLILRGIVPKDLNNRFHVYINLDPYEKIEIL